MFRDMRDEVFDAVLSAALEEYIAEEEASLPADAELSALYPTSKRAARKYRRIAKARARKGSPALVWLRRSAIVLLCAAAISFGVLLTNEAVRAAIYDAVAEWFDVYMTVDFSKSEKETEASVPKDISEFTIGYIPPEFELSDTNEQDHLREYTYFKENGEYLVISISKSDSTSIDVDTEFFKHEKMTINGNDAYVAYYEEEKLGTIVAGNLVYTIQVAGFAEKDELIRIVENIK